MGIGVGCLLLALLGAGEPRNVLLLIGDDHGTGDLGCYGNPDVKTPVLDRLASRGTRFTHAFATTASCSASRSVLYTGLHNHRNGQYGHAHAEHHFSHLPHIETVFTLLKANGYQTGLIGKRHVAPDDKYPLDFEPKVDPRNLHKVAGLTKEFLERCGTKPFVLTVGLVDPHRAARGFANERPHPGETPVVYDPKRLTMPPFLPDHPAARKEVAEYYQAISRLDQSVGKILEVFQAAGRLESTLIIYLSDNGMPFPGAKTNCYEPGIRLPLLVVSPAARTRGVVSDAMISWVDITPTILDWTGTKGPKYPLHGRSFLPVLEQPHVSGWDEVYASHTFHEITMYYPMRVLRTRRYKLIWNLAAPLSFPHASDLFESETWQAVLTDKLPKLGNRPVTQYLQRADWELYDLERDPHELTNLADDPAHAALRAELTARLKAFQQRTADPWVVRYRY